MLQPYSTPPKMSDILNGETLVLGLQQEQQISNPPPPSHTKNNSTYGTGNNRWITHLGFNFF